MPAVLEILRAAVLGLGRRLFPWLLGATGLVLLGELLDPPSVTAPLTVALALLAGAVLPLVVARGLRGWLHAGPLGLSPRGGGYLAAVGYGLGATLVVLPFVLVATWIASRHPDAAELGELAVALLVASFAGAGAGRVASRPVPVLLLSWLVGAGSLGFADVLLTWLMAGAGGVWLETLARHATLGTGCVLTLLFSQGALFTLTAVGPRLLPSRLEA